MLDTLFIDDFIDIVEQYFHYVNSISYHFSLFAPYLWYGIKKYFFFGSN